ncbi:hypothetical protein PAHAL_5G511600 [Panicum hallii]|uniref:Uncharacterized protein n=1 Tax=Panicum hallii TaxID=206008 RepID=A0A2T8IP73_9POAL|nr:hypothetical protein PAHAL_5G511600 [Panicum hallii]
MAAACLIRCPLRGLGRSGVSARGDPEKLDGGERGKHGGCTTGGRRRPRDRPPPASMSPAQNFCIYAY